MTPQKFDVIVVGSGLAGLSAALLLPGHYRIAILTKQDLANSASHLAQGGLAAVMDPHSDSLQRHLEDTLIAGAGLCDAQTARFVVENAPASIAWLQSLGVAFSSQHGQLHLTREGGHSARRIVHAADATGAAVQRSLIAQVRAQSHITLLENYCLVELITSDLADGGKRCVGLTALNCQSGRLEGFSAPRQILASGGVGQVYQHTTNPGSATGDGIAAAWRAGCRVANMEFIQFHPTSLFHPAAKSFLISEAVRGEGAQLLLPNGTRFMPAHDARAELAPRDVVARAIDFEMKKHRLACVYLDSTQQPPAFIETHFPAIHARCLALGIDMRQQAVPVVPAAHYCCGGVLTDLRGRSDIAGLHVIGEAACTGLHGANRLASNSLVECLVFARAAAQSIVEQQHESLADGAQLAAFSALAQTDKKILCAQSAQKIAQQSDALRSRMWDCVGIVRNNHGLAQAAQTVAELKAEINADYAKFQPNQALLELRNLLQIAELIVRSAQSRQESRGLHYNLDYPQLSEPAQATVLQVKV